VHVLFEMLAVFMTPSPIDFTFLKDFYREEVAFVWKQSNKRNILLLFLRVLADRSTAMELKVVALRLIVTPMLLATFERSNRIESRNVAFYNLVEEVHVVDSDMLALFMRSALDTANRQTRRYSETLRVELLKLTTVLIEHLGHELVEHRKDLIKFAWSHLKSDDSLSKQWAYVNVCRFVATYETPPKIILQVYVALLRTFQPEARELVKVALDVLIPALPKRLPVTDFVKAIKWTKKIMYEEGHALAQLVHMWQLVVRHPALFYPYRSQFMPQMVNSLNRLGLPPNCPVENRQLAVALADLIMNWESRHTQFNTSSLPRTKCQFQLNKPNGTSVCDSRSKIAMVMSKAPQTEDEFQLTMTMIEMVANFLVRLALFASDNKEPAVQRLAPLCLLLFQTTLKAWPSAHIRFSYFEKLIATSNARLDIAAINDPPYSPTLLATCLDIVYVTLGVDSQPNTFFLDNLVKAQQLICPCFDVQNIKIQAKLRKVIARIADLYPPGHCTSSTTVFFYQQVKFVVESRLTSAMVNYSSASRPGITTANFKIISNAIPLVNVVDSMCKYTPSYISNHGQSLLRLAQILTFQHLNSTRKGRKFKSPSCNATPMMSVLARAVRSRLNLNEIEPLEEINSDVECNIVDALCTCATLLSQALTDNILPGIRRELVVLMFVCLERSNSMALLFCISELICGWLTSIRCPLSKSEKNAFVEHIADIDCLTETSLQPLFARFLNNIAKHVSEGQISPNVDVVKTEDLNCPRLEHMRCNNLITTGLMALHPGVRAEFRAMFMQDITNTVSHHVFHMFQFDWSRLSNRFWLVIVIEFMLEGIDVSGPIKLTAQLLVLPNECQTFPVCTDMGLQQQYRTACGCLLEQRTSLQSFIEPLKELVHAHLRLAERIWEDLLPRTCLNVETHQQRQWQVAITNSMFKQFTTPYHQPKLQVPALLPCGRVDVKPAFKVPFYEIKNPFFSIIRSRRGSSFLASRELFTSHSDHLFDTIEPSFLPPLNVPQALLRVCGDILLKSLAISKKTYVPLSSISSFASKYNCRHAALQILERVVVAQQNISFCTRFNDPKKSCAYLFSEFKEVDLRVKAINDCCTQPMSSVAFALRRYGFIPQAQEIYLKNIIEELKHGTQSETLLKTGCNQTLVFEADIWCSEWLGCARDMSQWALLADLLKHSVVSRKTVLPMALFRPTLLLEAAWKIHKWDEVRQHLSANAQVFVLISSTENSKGKEQYSTNITPQMKLLQTRLAIVDGNYDDVEQLCGECIQLALESWCSLPRPRLGLATHDPLLHLFHELIEVHESSQLLHEAIQHSRALTYPDLSMVAHTWRNRLPNDWDSISDWDDIMRWRDHVFLTIQKAFSSWGTADQISQLHDASWTVSALARIARKQGLLQSTQASFSSRASKGYHNLRMNVDDAFNKLRERILTYRLAYVIAPPGDGENNNVNTRTQAQAGLYLIKNTAVDLFNAEQRSELFRLKGLFLGALGRYRDAHNTFSAATRACSTYGRAWYSWAALCDVNCSMELSSSLTKHLVHNSFTCYLAAVECGYTHAFVCGMARVLCLLRVDEQSVKLTRHFRVQLHAVPISAWIPWIPQLLSMLGLSEVKNVLSSLIRSLPQALYYSLQAQNLCNTTRRLEISKIHGCEVLSQIRLSNAKLAAEMDTLGSEITLGAQPDLSEELMLSLSLIQRKCHSSTEYQGPAAMYRLLHKVSMRYTGQYKVPDSSIPWGELPCRDLLIPLASKFIECNLISTLSEATLQDAMAARAISKRLQNWITVLENHTCKKLSYNKLDRLFSTLSRLHYEWQCSEHNHLGTPSDVSFLEIPGQYAHTFDTLRPELHLPLLKIEPSINFKMGRGRVVRRLGFIADEGRVRSFVPSVISQSNVKTDERTSQFFGIVDFALTHCRAAQQRRLRVSPIISVTFGPSMKITEDRWSWTSLCELNKLRCMALSKDEGSIVVCAGTHIRALFSKLHSLQRPPCVLERDIRRAIYNKICTDEIVTDILTKHVCATLDGIEAIWTYRRTFAAQLAIPSVLEFILAVQNHEAQATMLCQHTGRVCINEFRPHLTVHSSKLDVCTQAVPFRLTRNIERLLQPFLLDSVFKSTMGATLVALRTTLDLGGVLEPYMCLFLFDECASTDKTSSVSFTQIIKETQIIINRIKAAAPPPTLSVSSDIETGLHKIVKLAQSPENIATMLPHWQPWL